MQRTTPQPVPAPAPPVAHVPVPAAPMPAVVPAIGTAGTVWLSVREAAESLGRRLDGRLLVTPSAVGLWVKHGRSIRGRRQRVKLAARKFNGNWVIAQNVWAAFIEATSNNDDTGRGGSTPGPARRRHRRPSGRRRRRPTP
jgi:hypothetical protein